MTVIWFQERSVTTVLPALVKIIVSELSLLFLWDGV